MASRSGPPRVRVAVTWPGSSSSSPERYLQAVEAAGGEPLLVTPDDGLRTLPSVEALLLPGGVDVHPKRYGEEIDARVRDTLEIDDERDALELDALAAALERDLPVLGICRGVQLLNAALGGTLWQDLSLAGVEMRTHYQSRRTPRPPDWEAAHEVRLDPSSRLARILGETATNLGVNSFHHQAPARPAPGLDVSARSSDGLIEALESPNHRFVVGVQWHPERMVQQVPLQRRLFGALVAAALGD